MNQYKKKNKNYFKNTNKLKKPKTLKNKIFQLTSSLYILCTIKNTLISLTKNNGNLLKQWSTKSLPKTRLKKNTPYNIQFIINKINKYLQLKKIKKINIYLKGTGFGRYFILKNLNKNKIKIKYIFDKTPIPFNGCRQKKQKRR